MKRPLGLTLFGTIFVLWGLRGMTGLDDIPADEPPALRVLRFGFIALTLAIGAGLLLGRNWTMRAYVVWVGAVLVVGAVKEYYVAHAPAPVVLLAVGLLAAVYVAVGVYLRGALRESTS